MSSEVRQPGQPPSAQPDQDEAREMRGEAMPWEADGQISAQLSALPEGIVRRARLHLFPKTDNPPTFAAATDSDWQENWVVESQIAEESLESEPAFYEQQELASEAVEADEDAPTFPGGWSASPVVQALPATPAAPAADASPAPVQIETQLVTASEDAVQPVTQLVPVQVSAPTPAPQPIAEVPDSAFRKLSQLEAQYIAIMRGWLKDEGGKTNSPIPQLSSDEQVRLALEALNIELARKLQPRLPASFASVAQAYLFGWGPLDHLMRLEEVTEVMVNGSVSIFIERGGRLEPVGPGLDDESIYTIAERMTGRRPTLAEPMLDDRLKDGSRLNATHSSVSLLGASLSIRRFPQVALVADDLVRGGAVTPELLRFLEAMVRGRMNIVISGGTNTGKTTLLNILLGAIPPTQRLVIIEQAPAEIRCTLPNRGHLLTRPRTADGAAEVSVADLVRNALRMRPDRIVVGECRGGEALAMLQAMNTGHAGSLTTLHANNPFDALSRLETMVLMAESGLPHDAIRAQIARAIQIIVQTRRDPNGRRYISEVVQVTPSTDSASGYACSSLFDARLEQGRMVCRRTRAALDQDLMAQLLSYGVRMDEIQGMAVSGLGH